MWWLWCCSSFLQNASTPGHTFPSWCNGAAADGSYPQVCTACSKQHAGDSGWGPLRADLNSTYDFLEKLFTEVAGVFPEKYIHLGGDEVSFTCWLENKEVRQFMAKHGWSGADLENYYEGRLLDIVGGPQVKKSYMVWQEIFNNGVKVKKDTVIDVWKGFDKTTMAEATKAGYKVCLSGGWYLDSLKTTPGHFDGWDCAWWPSGSLSCCAARPQNCVWTRLLSCSVLRHATHTALNFCCRLFTGANRFRRHGAAEETSHGAVFPL